MRVEFASSVAKNLETDPKAVFLTGDLGFNAFEGLMKAFGSRILNAGVAEQNMVGVAAGLALEGFRPWVYSIAPFLAYRCVEQIRNDVCLHKLPVRIVGNGGGFTYGIMGATHYTLEDMSTLKALPNLTIYVPTTNSQVEACVNQIGNLKGPSYLRLGFSGFASNLPCLEENPQTLTRRYSTGTNGVIIGMGQATQIALRALEEKLIDGNEFSIFGISKFPFDLQSDQNLLKLCKETQNVLVVEEHYISGGLAESLKVALPAIQNFRILAPIYNETHTYGSAGFQLKQHQMTPADLSRLVKKQ